MSNATIATAAAELARLTTQMEAAYAAGKTLLGDAYLARVAAYRRQWAAVGVVLV